MTQNIHPELAKKLVELEKQYIKVTAFAESLPLFSKEIIRCEHTGENYCALGYHFGKLPLNWNINWFTNTPTNYPTEKNTEQGFINVYINCCHLFPDNCYTFATTELGKILPEIKVHFYDNLNSTFYFLPNEAEAGLKRLEQWYTETQAQCTEYLKKQRKAELEKELQKLSE